jgi:lysophospholipase L1-like esterase
MAIRFGIGNIDLRNIRSAFSWSRYWATRTPSNLLVTVTGPTTMIVIWTDAAAAADGLKLYLSTDNGVTYTYNSTIAFGVGTKDLTGLTKDTTYTVKLVAYKGTHESSAITDFDTTTILLSDVANMIFWYDSVNVTDIGGNADVATDLSGVTGNIQAPAAANRPAIVPASLNGYPALSFDGGDERLIKTGSTYAHPYTTFVIVKFPAANADSGVIGGTTTTFSVPVYLKSTAGNVIGIYSGNTLATITQVLNIPQIIKSIVNGASSIFRQGNEEISGNGGANTLKGIEWGGYANADAACCECLGYEVVGYSGIVSLENQVKISRALCVKYAVNDRQKYDGLLHNSVEYTDKITYKIRSAHSEFKFWYGDTTFSVKAKSTVAGVDASFAYLSVFVNDVYNQRIQFLVADTGFKTITVPAGYKKITLVESLTTRSGVDAGDVEGLFIQDILAEESFKKIPIINVAEKLVFLGDSITVGATADNPSSEGYSRLFAVENLKEVAVLGWGYGKLKHFATDAPTIVTTVGYITTAFSNVTTTKKLIIALGTNDWGLDTTAAATIKTWYGNLLDAINVADSDIHVYCISPLKRLTDPALLEAYRIAISEVCTARPAYTTYINGYPLLELTDMSDNVHPTTAGHKKLKDAIYTTICP